MNPALSRRAATLASAFALLAACERAPEPPPGIDTATLNAVLQRMDRLTAALERGQVAPPIAAGAQSQAAATERTPAAGDTTTLLARIDALEATLAVLQRSAPAGSLAVHGGAASAPVMRTQSVEQLFELKSRDQQQSGNEAFRSLFMLGPAQVLERLGTPTNVGASNGTWVWTYVLTGDRYLQLTFSNGVVIDVS